MAQVLKELKCPSCGSPIQQRLATSQTIVCPTCQAMVAVGMEELAVLAKSNKIPAPPVPIFPGDKAKIQDVEYFVMGRVLYRGWDDEDRWHWTEWLLGGANGQLAWLSYDKEQGFVLFNKVRVRTPFNPQTDTSIPTNDPNHRAMVTERYPARILAAEGELTWQAKVGEDLTMIEGKLGSKFYSVQQNAQEIEVHEGVKIPEAELAKAFNHKKWQENLTSRSSGAATLYTIGGVGLVLAIVAICFGIFAATNSGKKLDARLVTLNNAVPTASFPVTINGTGRPAVVKVNMRGSLPMQAAAEVDVNIVQPNGEDLYEFSQEFWHESGYDEGYWEESDYKSTTRFVPTQKGQYTVEVALGERSAGVEQVQVEVEVYENGFLATWLWAYGGITGLICGVILYYAFAQSNKGYES